MVNSLLVATGKGLRAELNKLRTLGKVLHVAATIFSLVRIG